MEIKKLKDGSLSGMTRNNTVFFPGIFSAPVRDYRKLKGNMEAQETVSCVILMVNAMLRLCETPAIKRILEADDMEIRSLGTGYCFLPILAASLNLPMLKPVAM